jgi:hypothetical protein
MKVESSIWETCNKFVTELFQPGMVAIPRKNGTSHPFSGD